MKEFIRKYPLMIILTLLVFLFAILSGYFYYHFTKENESLNQKYQKAVQDLKDANKTIEEKNKEIEDLKQANAQKVPSGPVNATNGEEETSVGSSIYDRIEGSDDYKSRIRAALDALSSGDGEHFSLANSQVGTIFEYSDYGGRQKERNIYIGAQSNDPSITASLITHEAQHVYNVYVDGIYSYNTREQELPCYEAELITAQRLGAPAAFIFGIENSIAYWQTQ